MEDEGEGSQTPVGGRTLDLLENGDMTQQLSAECCVVMSSVCWVCSAGWDSFQAIVMGRGLVMKVPSCLESGLTMGAPLHNSMTPCVISVSVSWQLQLKNNSEIVSFNTFYAIVCRLHMC